VRNALCTAERDEPLRANHPTHAVPVRTCAWYVCSAEGESVA
jgi:hypothetical protein